MQYFIVVGLTAVVLAAAAPLHAQQGTQDSEAVRQEKVRRVPVTVALVDSFPYQDADAVVIRRPDATPRDVILLSRVQATGERLAAAVAHLEIIRDRAGDTATAASVFRVREGATPRGLVKRNLMTAGGTIAWLRTTQPRDIPGIGRARATEVYLPSKAMRDARRAAAGQSSGGA